MFSLYEQDYGRNNKVNRFFQIVNINTLYQRKDISNQIKKKLMLPIVFPMNQIKRYTCMLLHKRKIYYARLHLHTVHNIFIKVSFYTKTTFV